MDDVEVQERERLLKKLIEMELDSTEVSRQANSLRDAIRKLQRERRFTSVYAADVAEQKDILLERLAQFESSNKTLRKMIRTQQSNESSKCNLQMKLSEAESTNEVLRTRLDEQERLAQHTQSLHDEIGMKDGEVQSLGIRLQVCYVCIIKQVQYRQERIMRENVSSIGMSFTRIGIIGKIQVPTQFIGWVVHVKDLPLACSWAFSLTCINHLHVCLPFQRLWDRVLTTISPPNSA